MAAVSLFWNTNMAGRDVMWIRSLFNFVKEENKVDYKVHLSISFCKLLYILSANIFFYFLLTVYFNYKTVYVRKYFIHTGTPKIYFLYMYKIAKQGAFGS